MGSIKDMQLGTQVAKINVYKDMLRCIVRDGGRIYIRGIYSGDELDKLFFRFIWEFGWCLEPSTREIKSSVDPSSDGVGYGMLLDFSSSTFSLFMPDESAEMLGELDEDVLVLGYLDPEYYDLMHIYYSERRHLYSFDSFAELPSIGIEVVTPRGIQSSVESTFHNEECMLKLVELLLGNAYMLWLNSSCRDDNWCSVTFTLGFPNGDKLGQTFGLRFKENSLASFANSGLQLPIKEVCISMVSSLIQQVAEGLV